MSAAPAPAPEAPAVADPVGETPGATRIGFRKADHANASEILWQNLARSPDAPALDGPGGRRTYAALVAEAARWGHALAAHGLARGDRVAMQLDDRPEHPAALMGAIRAGFVPVLLNTQATPDLLAFFLADSEARLAVCEAALAPGLRAAAPTLRIVTVGEGGTAPAFTAGFPDRLPCADTSPDDMAFWMYSSGSTGRPKGIVHLQHDMAYTAMSYGAHVLRLSPSDRVMSVPKIFFAYGFGNSITFPFWSGACAVLLPGRPEPARVLAAIGAHRPSVLFGLPTLYAALVRAPEAAGADLASLRLSLSAAEVLPKGVSEAWRVLAGHDPVEGLGSTEMLHVYLSNTEAERRPGAAGRVVPGYEVRLLDAEGREVGPGEEGVMWVRGHSSAPCYWRRPDKTAETMRGDWVHTGDRFREEGGFYVFQGRADDLVKVSGQWVRPLEVERRLAEHGDVHECAVLAERLADGRTGLRAVVRPRDGVAPTPALTQALRAHLKAALLPHQAPRRFTYLDALPHTGTGKIDRQALLAAGEGEP